MSVNNSLDQVVGNIIFCFLPVFIFVFLGSLLKKNKGETNPNCCKLYCVKCCTNIQWRVAPCAKVFAGSVHEKWEHMGVFKGVTEEPEGHEPWLELLGSWSCAIFLSETCCFPRHMAKMEFTAPAPERTGPELQWGVAEPVLVRYCFVFLHGESWIILMEEMRVTDPLVQAEHQHHLPLGKREEEDVLSNHIDKTKVKFNIHCLLTLNFLSHAD